MANNATVTLTFKVSEDGSLKLATGNINKAAKATDNLATSQQKLGKTSDETNYKLNQGTIGSSSAARSFSKLNQAIGEGPNGLVGAYATLAANAFAVSAAFNVLREATQAEMVMKGLEVQGARLGVTLTNTAQTVQELARGQLSLTESMQATAQASAVGFSSKSIEEITVAAQNASIALGRNMGDSMDRLIKGTSKLEPELLDELGIMVKLEEATNKYALATGKNASSLTSFERRQAFLNAALEESRVKFGGLSDEVEADPYTKLAASFSNLTKETLNFVNSTLGVGSVVNFLAENTTALIAVLVMFAGTISRQLVPSLYEVSESALIAKTAIDNKIKSQKAAIAVTLRLAAAEKKAAAAAATSNLDVGGSPEKAQQYIKALKEGNAVEGQREAAIRSVTGAIAGNTAALNRMTDTESVAYKEKQALIAALRKQKEALAELTTAELNHANVVSASENKLKVLRTESKALRNENIAIASRANAIEAAGEGRLRDSYRQSQKSLLAYNLSLTRTAQAKTMAAASGGFFARSLAFVANNSIIARTGLFALSLGVRAVGAALLNAIPIIGQLLFAFSLLIEYGGMLWDWMFPPPAGQEALDKAKTALDEIITRVDETAKKTSAVFADKGASALEAAGAYLALSNTVREVGDALAEVEQAQKQLGVSSTVASSKLLETALDKRGQTLGEDVVSSEAFKSLNSLTKLGFAPLNKEIMDATINSKEFNQATDKQKIDILSKAVETLSDKYASVGHAIAELRSNYKNLDDATSSFIKSATPSTPYDGLVENLTATKVSINNLEAELAKGTITFKDFNKQITDIGSKGSGLLTSNTQDQIQSLQKLNTAVKNSEEQLSKITSGPYSTEFINKEREITALKREQSKAERDLASDIKKDIAAQQQKLLSLQRQTIIIEGQLKLEQAKYNSTKKFLSETGAGYQVLVNQEEKIRDIQVGKIRAEQAILTLLNTQNQIKLDAAITDKNALDIRIANIKAGKEDLNILTKIFDTFKSLLKLGGIDTSTTIENLEAEAKILEGTITNLEAEASKLGNAIDSMDFSVAAILAENLTEAEKAAEKLRLDFENIQKLSEKIKASTLDVLIYEEKREALLNASSISTIKEAKELISKYKRDEVAAADALKTAEDKLNIEIKALQAGQDRVGAESEAGKAIGVSIQLKQQELKITQDTAQIQKEILSATLAIDLAEKFKLDTLGNGLEIQQNALSLLQKELDLRGTLIDQEKQLATLRAKILVGDKASPALERSIEAKAAAEQYNLALDQFGLKMAAIDAEYAILEAQKLQLEYNLKAQYAFLEAQYRASGGIDAVEQTGLDQLSNAIGMLGNVNYDVLKETAKTAEKNTLELLRLRAIEASGPSGGVFGGLGGAVLQSVMIFDNMNKSTKTLKDANEKAKQPIENLAKVHLPDFSKATIDAEKALGAFTSQIQTLDLNIPELKNKLFLIADTFNEFLNKLEKEGGIQSQAANMGQIAGASAKEIAKNAFEYTKKAFPELRVDEFGVKTGHKKDSMHYESRAFDVNVPGSGVEANNPAHRAQLDKVAQDLSSKGIEVLWNGWIWKAGEKASEIRSGNKHYDHLHAEIDEASYKAIKKMMETTTAAISSGATKAVEETKSAAPAATAAAAAPVVATAPLTRSQAAIDVEQEQVGTVPTFKQDTPSNIARPIMEDSTPIVASASKAKGGLDTFLKTATPSLEYFIEQFKSLGPEGNVAAVVLSNMLSFGDKISTTFSTIGMSTQELSKIVGKDLTDTQAGMMKMAAGMEMAAAAIGAVNQILQASAQAKISNIDKEIAAEQKRDGKSSQSMAKIEAMEKKKDSIARKAFNTNKKLMIAQAVMSTAAGVTNALAAPTGNPVLNAVMAGIIGAMGLAQVAIIAGTSYEGGASSAKSASMPSSFSIGRRSDTVDLARGPNANAGGEAGFLRGAQGTGTNAGNYRTIGSAYGGELMRGYGNRGFVVGEKGPEVITPDTPITVTPANESSQAQSINASFNIQALDASGVQDILVSQKGNIIKMLREASNASGKSFMEDVNVDVYTRPSVGKL
jgi:hypothetical protein